MRLHVALDSAMSVEPFNDPMILANFQSLSNVCGGYYPTFDSYISLCGSGMDIAVVWKPFNYRIKFLLCRLILPSLYENVFWVMGFILTVARP